MKDSDGQVEKFVMTLHPWVPNPARESSRQVVQRMAAGSANNNSGGDTYLALDPDFFYVHDNSNGEENYPITFPAVSLTDSTQKMMVTATRKANGKVVFHFNQSDSAPGNARSAVNTTADSQPNLVFAEATPVVAPNFIAPDPGGGGGGYGGGGGGGGPAPCATSGGRGGDTGGGYNGDTYFDITNLHLWANGDGGHGSEIQMFVKNDDNYDDKCFAASYKYRFDKVYRPFSPGGQIDDRNTFVTAADGGVYAAPDVDAEGVDYSFVNMFRPDPYSAGFVPDDNLGFRIFDLSLHPGPWRLVLVDDDKDYKDFATNHVHSDPYYKDVQTYDMSNGQWGEVHTGFTTDEKTNGNSDGPIQESGTRNITTNNVGQQSNQYGNVKAQKYYSGRGQYFEYDFILDSQQ